VKNVGSGEEKLETAISYLLISGVALSLTLIAAGIIFYYLYYGNIGLSLTDQLMYIHGQDFFNFLWRLFMPDYSKPMAIQLMTAGMAVLLVMVYLRVIFSVVYFIWKRELWYVLITAFVLVVLTLSLALH